MLESTLWVDIDVTECMPRTCHLWSYAMLLCNRFLNNWGLKIWFWARAVKVQSNLFNWIALNSFYRSGRTVLWWCPILATSPTVARTLVAPEHWTFELLKPWVSLQERYYYVCCRQPKTWMFCHRMTQSLDIEIFSVLVYQPLTQSSPLADIPEYAPNPKWPNFVVIQYWYLSCFQLFYRFVDDNVDHLSHSIVDYDFAVASSATVVYDWGEQDLLWKKLLISLWYSPVLTFGREVSWPIAEQPS